MQRIDLHQFPFHPRSTLWPLGHRDTPLRHPWRVSLSWKSTLRNTTTEGLREKKCSYAVDKLEYSSDTGNEYVDVGRWFPAGKHRGRLCKEWRRVEIVHRMEEGRSGACGGRERDEWSKKERRVKGCKSAVDWVGCFIYLSFRFIYLLWWRRTAGIKRGINSWLKFSAITKSCARCLDRSFCGISNRI